MNTVLCYGDSNTFGTATVDRPDGRYVPDERWPGVLRSALGPGWMVIEEGLGGRTTVSDDPVEGADKNGRTHLPPCLRTHRPLDVVVIMLGTNDLKARFNKSAWEVAAGIGVLVDIVKTASVGRNEGVPEIIVVCPPPMRDKLPSHGDMFAGAPAKSREMARHYRGAAAERSVRFFDAGAVIKSSKVDGFHLDADAHSVLGRAIAAEIGRLTIPAA
ncbi:MAG: SGNH/GDSL hydrolase family protein [Bauldia sp.]